MARSAAVPLILEKQMFNGTHTCIPSLLFHIQGDEAGGGGYNP